MRREGNSTGEGIHQYYWTGRCRESYTYESKIRWMRKAQGQRTKNLSMSSIISWAKASPEPHAINGNFQLKPGYENMNGASSKYKKACSLSLALTNPFMLLFQGSSSLISC